MIQGKEELEPQENLKLQKVGGGEYNVARGLTKCFGLRTVAKTYPNFKAIGNTLREVKTATVNDWAAMVWADGEVYKSRDYKGLEIMDRVDGGDSFASGLINTSMARKGEVEKLMSGGSTRVQR